MGTTANPDSPNFYDVLGISMDASEEDVKRAYRRLALEWHPDKNPEDRELAAEKFKNISVAYEILSDPVQRRRFDTSTDIASFSKFSGNNNSNSNSSSSSSSSRFFRSRGGSGKLNFKFKWSFPTMKHSFEHSDRNRDGPSTFNNSSGNGGVKAEDSSSSGGVGGGGGGGGESEGEGGGGKRGFTFGGINWGGEGVGSSSSVGQHNNNKSEMDDLLDKLFCQHYIEKKQRSNNNYHFRRSETVSMSSAAAAASSSVSKSSSSNSFFSSSSSSSSSQNSCHPPAAAAANSQNGMATIFRRSQTSAVAIAYPSSSSSSAHSYRNSDVGNNQIEEFPTATVFTMHRNDENPSSFTIKNSDTLQTPFTIPISRTPMTMSSSSSSKKNNKKTTKKTAAGGQFEQKKMMNLKSTTTLPDANNTRSEGSTRANSDEIEEEMGYQKNHNFYRSSSYVSVFPCESQQLQEQQFFSNNDNNNNNINNENNFQSEDEEKGRVEEKNVMHEDEINHKSRYMNFSSKFVNSVASTTTTLPTTTTPIIKISKKTGGVQPSFNETIGKSAVSSFYSHPSSTITYAAGAAAATTETATISFYSTPSYPHDAYLFDSSTISYTTPTTPTTWSSSATTMTTTSPYLSRKQITSPLQSLYSSPPSSSSSILSSSFPTTVTAASHHGRTDFCTYSSTSYMYSCSNIPSSSAAAAASEVTKTRVELDSSSFSSPSSYSTSRFATTIICPSIFIPSAASSSSPTTSTMTPSIYEERNCSYGISTSSISQHVYVDASPAPPSLPPPTSCASPIYTRLTNQSLISEIFQNYKMLTKMHKTTSSTTRTGGRGVSSTSNTSTVVVASPSPSPSVHSLSSSDSITSSYFKPPTTTSNYQSVIRQTKSKQSGLSVVRDFDASYRRRCFTSSISGRFIETTKGMESIRNDIQFPTNLTRKNLLLKSKNVDTDVCSTTSSTTTRTSNDSGITKTSSPFAENLNFIQKVT